MHTYMDITPGDLKKIYALALKHAREKLLSPKAEDIMTKEVISITPDAPLEEAIRLLKEHHISGMPVVDKENRVTGVITETDIIAALTGKHRPSIFDIFKKRTEKAPEYVRDVMTSRAITVNPGTPIYDIANIFTQKKINRVPVVNEQNALLGIVARADIVRAYDRVKP